MIAREREVGRGGKIDKKIKKKTRIADAFFKNTYTHGIKLFTIPVLACPYADHS